MRTLLFTALIFFTACQTKNVESAKSTFFIGTYTQHEGHVDGKGNGIYKLTFDPATLELQVTDTIKHMTNPSFLALSKDQSLLYAVNEISPGTDAIGQFEAYSLGQGSFGQKMFSASTESHAPCHIALNKSETMAIVCNYVGGIVSVFPLPMQENSKAQIIKLPGLQKSSPRQDDAHPHSAVFSADGRLVYVADLGADRIMCYQVEETQQKLTPAETPFFELPDGSGPRHMALSPDGKILYVLCELSNTVMLLDISDKGVLTSRQSIGTLPADFQGQNTSADIHLSPDGKFLYTSNRGHHSIAVFKVKSDGTLASVGHISTQGRTPRNFHVTNDGRWLLVANQDTDDIVLFNLEKGDMPVLVKSIRVNTPVAIVEMK